MTNQSYEAWLKAVDALVVSKLGLGVDDGSDWPSLDTYESGASVKQGARVWAEWQDAPGLKNLFK